MRKKDCSEGKRNCESNRWIAISLSYIYGIDHDIIAQVFAVTKRTIYNWVQAFENEGRTAGNTGNRRRHVTPSLRRFIENYIIIHPCFYLEELQEEIKSNFPGICCSIPTICRILRHDLNITRKVLTKRAREAASSEICDYYNRLSPFYTHPDQLVFVDETSKDGRAAIRRYAWSQRGTPAIVKLPNSRGKRISVLASFTTSGFSGWFYNEGTYDRKQFHEAFRDVILPTLNPWPLPRSIVIMDNAKIHMYKELEETINSAGALLCYLPPYCPHLNPIEFAFGNLKKWIQKNANIAYSAAPLQVLPVALKSCVSEKTAQNFFRNCGYDYRLLSYPK